jgi:hypothetical protein
MLRLRLLAALNFALLGACPSDDSVADRAREPRMRTTESAAPAPPTHSGLISVQDVSIANLPQAGHGLTVQSFFLQVRKPDFEEQSGVFGCKVSAYDVASGDIPHETDQGTLKIGGIAGGEIRCGYVKGRGYVCPTASGTAPVEVAADGGRTTYAFRGVTLTAADVGRYLQVSGASQASNNGAFAILALSGSGAALVANPAATAEKFDASYTIVAGAGPTPKDLYSPFEAETKVIVALEPGGDGDFDAFEVEITPGAVWKPDQESAARMVAVRPDGEAVTLSCEGEGGDCGVAAVSIVRITTTDADVTGLSPTAMPPAKKRAVEIQCAAADTGTIRVPAEPMKYLKEANEASPITRIRTAFMRDGYAFANNQGPRAANSTVVVAGRGVLGFSTP